MEERLPAHLEVASIMRRVTTGGGFATILRKGDPDRGSILLFVSGRGAHFACLERVVSLEGGYRWQSVGPGESASSVELSEFLARRTRFDEDSWAIELDIADPERFIAETISSG